MARRKAPRIPDALLDQLLAGADPKTAFDANGLLDDLKKALAERALNAELDHHLASDEAGNSRNGYGRKTVTTETGRIELEIPRDRQATFDPQLIAKYQRRFPGFDYKIISMYARGMSAREVHPGVAGAERSHVKLIAPQILWLGLVRRQAKEGRELTDLPDIVALRVRAELADGHVLDHPPTQRRDGIRALAGSVANLISGQSDGLR
jgi:hypothetical protein